MAALTAGQIVTTVSEFRSKIAVLEMLVLHLRTNYVSSEGKDEDEPVPPEMYCERSDFARVSEQHIQATINDLVEKIGEMKDELEEWESLPIETPKSGDPKKKKKKADDDSENRPTS